MRTIHSIRIRNSGSLISIEFAGEGFLYKMVRMITARWSRQVRAKMALREIRRQLEKNVRSNSSSPSRGASGGLFLIRVRY